MNIQAEINEKEMKEIMVKIYKTKRWLFEKINKIDKPLARLIKEKRERRIKSTKLEMKKGRGYNRQWRNTKDYETVMNNCMAIREPWTSRCSSWC